MGYAFVLSSGSPSLIHIIIIIIMEEVNEFKYLGSVMCKHGGTEGETRERALQGRKVVGSLRRIMSGRSVSMEVKRDLRNTVIVPTLTYASKTWA